MNKNTLVFIFLSIAFGLGAVLIARNWLSENQPQNLIEGQVSVFTVNTELPVGTLLAPKYIVSTVISENLVPQGAITDKSQLQEMIVKHRLYEGDILRQQRLAKKGEGSSLASLIKKNMRAISIRVNDVVGVAGFLLPGNKVDVLSTYKYKGKNVATDVILSNAKILAIDQKASDDENKPQIVRAVTLELNLRQAELLMNAKDKGSIQLALRNPNDQTETVDHLAAAKPDEMEIALVKTSAATASPEREPVKINTPIIFKTRKKIEVIRGAEKESVQVTSE